MTWGSNWAIRRHMRTNAFTSEPVVLASRPGRSRIKGVNPLLRVSAPAAITQQAVDISSSSTSIPSAGLSGTASDDYLYATGAFDRRQSEGRRTDSRWLRHHQDPTVPGIDEHLTVAFQKLLRDERYEEQEFLVLIAATLMDEDWRHAAY